MGEKDIAEKALESFNDVFADLINVSVFNGRQKIVPESLADAVSSSQYKFDKKLHEQVRDVSKYWNGENNIRLVFMGIENQTRIDKDMPLRVIGYDGAAYRAQLNLYSIVEGEDGKKHRIRNDRYPVITIVLNFSMTKWKTPKSLKDTFQNLDKLPPELMEYIHDYKINVIDIAYLTMDQVKMFKSDFRYVAEYLVCKRLKQDYKPDAKTLKHKDEVLKLFKAITGDNRYEEILAETAGEESISMCDVLDKMEARGIEKGKAEAEEKISKLNAFLSAAGRMDELVKSFSDKVLRHKLMQEYEDSLSVSVNG